MKDDLFSSIAKLLALGQLKKELPKAMDKVSEDPLLSTAMQQLQVYSKEVERLLPEFCKRNPNSVMCKDKDSAKNK